MVERQLKMEKIDIFMDTIRFITPLSWQYPFIYIIFGDNMNIKDELDNLYDKWLMDNCSDKIHCKDDLLNLSCDGFMYDEFMEELKKEL